MKILIVEDETKLAQYLSDGLRREGFSVELALNGVDGLHLASTGSYDALVLDGNLPGIDGLTLLTALRRTHQTPVLMLTARSSIEDKVLGLKTGADDYLVKPFSFSELTARLHSLLRRAQVSATPLQPSSMRLGDLEVDTLKRRATREGVRLPLSSKEFSLLALLMERRGQVVTRTEIAAQVWDMNFDSDTNVIEVAIRRLRNKLDVPFATPLLHTMRGVGYVLELREDED